MINVIGTMLGDIVVLRVVVASGAIYKGRIDMEAALKNQQAQPAEKKEMSGRPRDSEQPSQREPVPVAKPQEPPKTIPGPPPPK